MIGKEVPVVLDPTLLLDEEDYKNVESNDVNEKGDYIFFYSPGFDRGICKFVKELSKKYNIPVITWSRKNYEIKQIWTFGFKTPEYENPAKYLSLIKNAKLVLTTSFHGAIFATTYRKKFYVLKNGAMFGNDDRVRTMLNTLKMNDRLIDYKIDENKDYLEEIKQLLRDLLANEDIDFRYIPPSRYTKFSIFYNNMYFPYGTGLFDPTRSIAKQLLLVEAALASYRATRTPIRNKYLVEIGSTPESEIPSLVTNVKDRIKKEKILDGELNGFDSIPNFLGIEEDMWIPVINGTPTLNIEQLPVPTLDPYINDADYFKKKMLGSLGIPPSYLAEENTTSTRALLTLEDIRFARTIKKYQNDLNVGLNDLINNSFIILNQAQLVNQIKLALPEPTGIESKLRMEELNNQIDAAQKFISLFPKIPKTYILNNLMSINDDDLEEMRTYIEKDKRYKDIVASPDKENEEDMMGGGIGAGFGDIGTDFDIGLEDDSAPNLPNAFFEVTQTEETTPTPELDTGKELNG